MDKAAPLMHEVLRRAAKRLIPLQVTIELTYRCNLRCKHCYVDQNLRRNATGELSCEEWAHVFDELLDSGTLYLLFTGGEVLAYPDFFEVVSAARERRFRFGILTNGTLIDSSAIARLKELKPDNVGLSLYGATAQTHEATTQCAGSFAATTGAIARLVRDGFSVMVQTMLMDGNIHEAPAMRELVQGLGAWASASYALAPTKGCSLAPQQLQASFAAIEHYLTDDPFLGRLPPGTGPAVCKAGRGICAISPYGDVFPCVLMPMKLGNLREQGFQEIWRDHTTDDLLSLRSLSAEDFEGCATCPDAPFCQRCLGVALSETGSLTGRPSSACRYAAIRAKLYHVKGGEE